MQKKEADFGILFRHWIMSQPRLPKSASLEIKDSRGKDYIPYREIEDSQIRSGLASKIGPKGNLIRVAAGTVAAPDYIWLYKACAYVIIKYPKCFCLIDVETLQLEKDKSTRKSLTSDRAKEIAVKVVKL